MQAYLTALDQFSSSLKNQSWIKATAGIRESLNNFLGFIDQSQQLFQKESERLGSLNENGVNILGTANALFAEVSESIAVHRHNALQLVGVILFSGFPGFFGAVIDSGSFNYQTGQKRHQRVDGNRRTGKRRFELR